MEAKSIWTSLFQLGERGESPTTRDLLRGEYLHRPGRLFLKHLADLFVISNRGTKKVKPTEKIDEEDDGDEDDERNNDEDEEIEEKDGDDFGEEDKEMEEIEEDDDEEDKDDDEEMEESEEEEDDEDEPVSTIFVQPPLPATPVSLDTSTPKEACSTTDPANPPRQKRQYRKKPKLTYAHTLPAWFLAENPAEQFRMTSIMLQHAYKAQLAKTDEAAAHAIRKAKSQGGIERALNALMEPGRIGFLPVPMFMLETRMRNTWRLEKAKGGVVPGTNVNAWKPRRRD
jgi:hypothetical protein